MNIELTQYEAILLRDSILAEIDKFKNTQILKKEIAQVEINDLEKLYDKMTNILFSDLTKLNK